ncbi:MAG TPA: hypothetical protein VFK11_01800 [Candidatus Saccharimonadales bacterium]|nr:hypothetical protein [Candidatus Saccharimonadales bacterium]
MPPQGFENRNLLDEALAGQGARDASAAIQRAGEGRPCPPDPELDGLFADFAGRMPKRSAIPFVEQTTGEARSRRATGKVSERTITKGWMVFAGKRPPVQITGSEKIADIPVWSGLAVDVSGQPWLAQQAYKAGKFSGRPSIEERALRINGSRGLDWAHKRGATLPIDRLGRPQGADLRQSIAGFLGLGLLDQTGNVRRQDLPQLIAGHMAKLIR